MRTLVKVVVSGDYVYVLLKQQTGGNSGIWWDTGKMQSIAKLYCQLNHYCETIREANSIAVAAATAISFAGAQVELLTLS